ncbi:MAG: hypothetical protein IPJ40_23785 [Saprospirales bacterium]|nr:hypothetical protein [Saprospirales bacterium]
MKFKSITSVMVMLFATQLVFGQVFSPPAEGFSRKKPAYVTLEDGTEVTGTIDKLKRKKGLISNIIIEKESGEALDYTPDQVKFMYLPQSGLDKLGKGLDFLNDATKWNRDDLDAAKIKDGYAYFEKADVMVKKKKMPLMMQLLNPSFSGKVRVYHDPYAAETTQVSVGGIGVAGGDDKSYYVKKGDGVAFKLEKKNFEDEFAKLFGDCDSIKKAYGKKPKWKDIEAIAYKHATECN